MKVTDISFIIKVCLSDLFRYNRKSLHNLSYFTGDQYTRDEFRRHKNATPEQTQAFMVEWTNYAITIAKQLGVRGAHMSKTFGQNFKDSDLENFNDEQIYQLYELYKASIETDNGNQKET